MSTWTDQEANEAIEAVLKRATTDANFRQLCLSDPAAAVKAETGKDLPEEFTINVVDNSGASLTVVLPDFVGSGELSDDELEQVAGGKGRSGVGPGVYSKTNKACDGNSFCVGQGSSAYSRTYVG